ncbi:MAG TPA: ABC transporter ATP-binding protein [Anaerolineaceae bacterium]|nr:ABC transporter ATP-binding protein [Anaerolineaceae bacterium]
MRYFVIRTENLTKYYGRRLGIEDLTIEVEPGEVYGFLGPDNAGKTTTVRLLLDTIRPTHGRALVLGMDCQKQAKEIRLQAGFLPEEFSLFNHMSVADFLRYLSRQRSQASLAYGTSLSEQFGLNLGRRIVTLSALEKRQLGIVQAFLHHPDLLILDEPTKGLDRNSASLFYRLVSEARADGRSVFLTSKSLLEMERICDRVAILHAGKLIAVERGVQLRSRAVRRIEMRFADPVQLDDFRSVPNIDDLRLEDNKVFCIVHGEPDCLIKVASRHRVTDFISQQISLEEAFSAYYGIGQYN